MLLKPSSCSLTGSWQAFHYGRQKIGVYALASIAQTEQHRTGQRKMAIDFGTISDSGNF